ncbi:MAG: tRNA pseudouridine(55) synthase TruB [Clostridia bacterium]|nr:tRNA pseudouridine(55) synthase TruB [Clostridia bacterium]
MPVDGVVNFFKPRGMTSQQAVNILKKLFSASKAGHCGTLDPDACGVLPVMLGAAVKLSEYLVEHDKSYSAVMALGFCTDTGDISGKVTARTDYIPGFKKIKLAAKSFEGGYMQTPPMYSALKVGGKKLVDSARRGIEIERAPRRVEIQKIEVSSGEDGAISLDVDCSRGTYIRTLCEDVAAKAGTLGCMASLVRTRVGNFYARDSVALETLRDLPAEERLKFVVPPEDALPAFGKLFLPPFYEKLVRNGCAVETRKFVSDLPAGPRTYRLYGENGFFGVGETYVFDTKLLIKHKKILR